MAETSTKPYFLRALHEWCIDNGYTPFMTVLVDKRTQVPHDYVKDGEIVLNIGPIATHKFTIGNEWIEFQARFGGTACSLAVPVDTVSAIYARETGQGMAFEVVPSLDEAGVENTVAKGPSTVMGRSAADMTRPRLMAVTNNLNNKEDQPNRTASGREDAATLAETLGSLMTNHTPDGASSGDASDNASKSGDPSKADLTFFKSDSATIQKNKGEFSENHASENKSSEPDKPDDRPDLPPDEPSPVAKNRPRLTVIK